MGAGASAMKSPKRVQRRDFLQIVAVTAASGAAAACGGPSSRYRVLTEHEAATVTAIADRIIPPDDYPGAGEAGAARFVDRCLAGPYRHWREAYRAGLREIDEASREAHGKPFFELTPEQQDTLLEAREETSFFRMVRDHTMQSYYGDPRHGGNPDAISWRMLGVPNPPVRGREHYDLTES